ncbi:hypothetical protein SL053_002485 [Flavobacterium psychrophilum]|nr:hypothetical protein [Flavobacterium psychrophilum]
MKKIINSICVLILVISCKGKITNIKISAHNNDEKHKCFIFNGEKPDYEEPLDTIYLYKPIAFRLFNNTGRKLSIISLTDNFHSGGFKPHIINNLYYPYLSGSRTLNSKDSIDITMFIHLPIPIKMLNKVYSERLLQSYYNGKYDSIVVEKINDKLHKKIDSLLKKKEIIIHYRESKNSKEKAMAIYCVNQQRLAVFRSDSLAKVNPDFKYNCD